MIILNVNDLNNFDRCRMKILILSMFISGHVFGFEDSGKSLTCKELTQSSDILKCSDGKYYSPNGDIISYQRNEHIKENKRDSKELIDIDSYHNQETLSSSTTISK